MDLDVRPITPGEADLFVRTVEGTFGDHPRPEEIENELLVLEPDRALAAYDGSEMVGTAAVLSMSLTVPGGRTPMAGVSDVGVSPTHRRRGLLTELMRRQLQDIHDQGEALAGLWASESLIYGRFGYGWAAFGGDARIERARSGFVDPATGDGRVRLLDRDQALPAMRAAYERALPGRPGMMARSEVWWDYVLFDPEHRRDGASASFFAVHEGSGGADGYVIYRIKRSWDEGFPQGTVTIEEMVAGTPEAHAALWQYCFGVDLVTEIRAFNIPVDDPIRWRLADPRRLRVTLFDSLWLRVVDVPKALAERRYAVEGSLVLEVVDPFCPWNEGRFELRAGPEGAVSSRTEAAADLVVRAGDLGATYLGGVRFADLAAAGRVSEATAGAIGRADAMFSWSPAPWTAHDF
jgi:predicted acetyltransferase